MRLQRAHLETSPSRGDFWAQVARRTGSGRTDEECAARFYALAEEAEAALEALEANPRPAAAAQAPARAKAGGVADGAAVMGGGGASGSMDAACVDESPWLEIMGCGVRRAESGAADDRRASIESTSSVGSAGDDVCSVNAGGGGLLRRVGATRRAQIGQYVRGSKAKKLLDGGAEAAWRRREQQAKALQRDRARMGGSVCGAAPLLDAFTAPQPDDDDDEVGAGNELKDDSESEDDYCFD